MQNNEVDAAAYKERYETDSKWFNLIILLFYHAVYTYILNNLQYLLINLFFYVDCGEKIC